MQEVTLEQIEQIVSQLSTNDQYKIFLGLKNRLQQTPPLVEAPGQSHSLRGIWAGKFPDDLDVMAAIREIRDEWKQELEEFGEKHL